MFQYCFNLQLIRYQDIDIVAVSGNQLMFVVADFRDLGCFAVCS